MEFIYVTLPCRPPYIKEISLFYNSNHINWHLFCNKIYILLKRKEIESEEINNRQNDINKNEFRLIVTYFYASCIKVNKHKTQKNK